MTGSPRRGALPPAAPADGRVSAGLASCSCPRERGLWFVEIEDPYQAPVGEYDMDGCIVREAAEAVVDHDDAGLALDSGEIGAAVGYRHDPSVRIRVMFRGIALQSLHIVVRRIERNRQQPD